MIAGISSPRGILSFCRNLSDHSQPYRTAHFLIRPYESQVTSYDHLLVYFSRRPSTDHRGPRPGNTQTICQVRFRHFKTPYFYFCHSRNLEIGAANTRSNRLGFALSRRAGEKVAYLYCSLPHSSHYLFDETLFQLCITSSKSPPSPHLSHHLFHTAFFSLTHLSSGVQVQRPPRTDSVPVQNYSLSRQGCLKLTPYKHIIGKSLRHTSPFIHSLLNPSALIGLTFAPQLS